MLDSGRLCAHAGLMTLENAVLHAFAPAAEAVRAGRIPGAVLGAVRPDGARAVALAGLAQREPEAVALERDHLFDLASLTKVMLTTPEILRLVEEGMVDLDDALSRHLPDLHQYVPDHPVRAITIRACLTHTTGLPAVEPIYTWGQDAATLKALVLQRDWRFGAAVYSDINFILLGLLVERLRGRALRAWDVPAGLAIAPGPSLAVATERCAWRGRLLRGEVHDENAAALGGIAGHAGLFGSIDGVLDFAAAMLEGRLLSPAAMALLARPQTETRTLGWQAAHPGWSGGALAAPGAIGHTGFTGTGMWLDPVRGVAWALLTNRVHPSRHAESGIVALRQSVGNRLLAGMR